MAEHKIAGDQMCLFIGRTEGSYSQVVCLTSLTIPRTTAEIDAKSFCGPDTLPGTQTNGPISAEGQGMYDPDSGRISIDELEDMWKGKDRIYFKVSKAVPLEGDLIETGSGFISQLDENFTLDAAATFTFGISVYGLISKSTATS